MRLLLDTHALLWWLSDNQRLGEQARALIADANTGILVSVVSLWEIVIKVRVNKLKVDIRAVQKAMDRDRFDRLSIAPGHLSALANLPAHHGDPFDHLLIAQAIAENIELVSDDRRFALYPVQLRRCSEG